MNVVIKQTGQGRKKKMIRDKKLNYLAEAKKSMKIVERQKNAFEVRIISKNKYDCILIINIDLITFATFLNRNTP
jgi:hypothetical protein